MTNRYLLINGDRKNLCDPHAESRAAELKREERSDLDQPCDDCQEIAARPERRLLLKAIEEVEEFTGDGESGHFIYPSCNECTEGSTPARFDRGPCWRHAAKKLLKGEAVLTNEKRKIEMHAAIIAAVMDLADSDAGDRIAFIDAAALTATLNERLDALVDSNLI